MVLPFRLTETVLALPLTIVCSESTPQVESGSRPVVCAALPLPTFSQMWLPLWFWR